MNRPCDILIAATEYDSTPSTAILARLEELLPAASLCTLSGDGDTSAALRSARLLVVLHGWMWGRSEHSRAVDAAIESRVGKGVAKFLVVVALDDAPLPQWAARAHAVLRGDATADVCLSMIVEAARANGVAVAETADVAAQRVALDTHAMERDMFFATHRATAACDREFRKLVEDIVRRARMLESAEVQSSPGRCVVQLGDVALTVSWIRGRSAATDGRLMIVEWDGTVQRGSRRAPEKTAASTVARAATVRREHVLFADATRETNWRWSRERFAWASYAGEDLAAACVDSLAAARTAGDES